MTEADGALPLLVGPEELAKRIRDDYAMSKRLTTQKNIVVE